MKALILSFTLVAILFVACNNDGSESKGSDTAIATGTSNKENNISRNPVSEILTSYLKIKNSLTNDNDKEAAASATELAQAFKGVDKETLNAQQNTVFTDIVADAIEHAEHIATNVGNLVHQREHFETLSEEIYDLAKVSKTEQKLYYTNCPMYNNNKGANWLSETKDVKNPYLGQAMLTCGTVKEELN